MSNGALKLLSGAGAGDDPVYVDDVFSCFLYEGDNTNPRSITNGIDLAGEGGMVWIKRRTGTDWHVLSDTERGTNSRLHSNTTSAAGLGVVTGFNSDGFDVNDSGQGNFSGDYVSWTFRKQPGFFDVVTYTGNKDSGGNQAIAHNLDSVPGMIITKSLTTSQWSVYHVGSTDGGTAKNSLIELNADGGGFGDNDAWNNTAPTATHFYVGNSVQTNIDGQGFVAYLFANDAQDFGENEDEAIIKCGSFNAGSSAFVEDLGFEPQWLLIKKESGSGSWQIIDNMRGSKIDKNGDHASQSLVADDNGTENSESYSFGIANKGIGVEIADGADYIYVAIRRSHKPASEFTADKMFKAQSLSAGEGSDTFISTGFPVDMVWTRKKSGAGPFVPGTRLQGGQKSGPDLMFDVNNAEGTNSGMFFLDHSDGVTVDFAGGHFNVSPAATDTDYIRYFFRRAKGYFDVVAYTSNTTYPNTVKHNLGVVPELIIIKRRDGSSAWAVYSSATGNAKHLVISSNASASSSSYWNSTTPTSTVFSVGGQDEVFGYNGYRYIAYLFATADGISKVGSYTGNGSNQDIDCGFSNGASLVLIKRTDANENWHIFDTARGIVAGNDGAFRLDATLAELSADGVDPYSAGFNVVQSASYNNNVSGGEYIFLAIA